MEEPVTQCLAVRRTSAGQRVLLVTMSRVIWDANTTLSPVCAATVSSKHLRTEEIQLYDGWVCWPPSGWQRKLAGRTGGGGETRTKRDSYKKSSAGARGRGQRHGSGVLEEDLDSVHSTHMVADNYMGIRGTQQPLLPSFSSRIHVEHIHTLRNTHALEHIEISIVTSRQTVMTAGTTDVPFS